MTLTSFLAKAFEQFTRAFTNKLLRRMKAEKAQIGSGGLSDIWQVGELLRSGAINFVWAHKG